MSQHQDDDEKNRLEVLADLRALADTAVKGDLCSCLIGVFLQGFQDDTGKEPCYATREVVRHRDPFLAAGCEKKDLSHHKDRWIDERWDPERQRALIDILRPVAEPVEWDRHHQAQWSTHFGAYKGGRRTDAATAYRRALALVANPRERQFLERRLREVGEEA